MKTVIVSSLLLIAVVVDAQTTIELLPNDAWRTSYQQVNRDASKLRAWISAYSRLLRDPALASVQLDYAELITITKFKRPDFMKTAAVQALAQKRVAELQDVECILRAVSSRVIIPRANEIARRVEEERVQLSGIISGRQ